jgi:hypothetical protein
MNVKFATVKFAPASTFWEHMKWNILFIMFTPSVLKYKHL